MARNRNIAVFFYWQDFFLFGCGRSVNPMPTARNHPTSDPDACFNSDSPSATSLSRRRALSDSYPKRCTFANTCSSPNLQLDSDSPLSPSPPTAPSRQFHAVNVTELSITVRSNLETQGIGQHLCLQFQWTMPIVWRQKNLGKICRQERANSTKSFILQDMNKFVSHQMTGEVSVLLQLCHGQKSFRGELV